MDGKVSEDLTLAKLLKAIEANDADYDTRYPLVLLALAVAHCDGLKAGIRIDPKEPEWPCAFIELPTGQITWHLPQHSEEWDGHSTEEKYRRINAFVKI